MLTFGLAAAAATCTGPNPAYRPAADTVVDRGVEPPGADRDLDAPRRDAAADVDGPAAAEAPDSRDADVDTAVAETATGPCPADPDLAVCLRFEGSVVNEARATLPIAARGVGFTGGPSGQAGRFDATTRVELGPSPALDTTTGLTVEAWVNPRVLPTGNARMGLVDYTREYALFLHPGGEVDCVVVTANGITNLRRRAGVGAGTWSALACVADDQRLALYRNGIELGSTNIARLSPSGDTDTMVIGGNFSEREPDPLDGQLDNVRIWRRARSAAELCSGSPGCAP